MSQIVNSNIELDRAFPVEDPIAILESLIAIPSQNPMGKEVSGDGWYEGRMSHWIELFFQRLQCTPIRMDAGEGRCNILSLLPGNEALPHLLYDAHQDTVPVEGMTIAPFEPTKKDGRIYGRGSCDVKGGMASMLAAFARLARTPIDERCTVVMCCSCDEELNQLGMKRLMIDFDAADKSIAWSSRLPDYVVVAEPTELDVVVAHMGVTRWKIHVPGTAAHSSDPTQGVNAIYRMGKLIQLVEQYASVLPDSRPPHPLCGGPSISLGTIQGGTSVNVVPSRCTIEIDRRVAPGESCAGAIEDVHRYLKERVDFPFEFEPPWCMHDPFPDTLNRNLAERVAEQSRAIGYRGAINGVRFGTHATNFAWRDIPTVVFGPGSIRQAHTVDEWVEIQQVRDAAEVLYRFAIKTLR